MRRDGRNVEAGLAGDVDAADDQGLIANEGAGRGAVVWWLRHCHVHVKFIGG